ncbi:hypothetical protein ACFYO1_36295 [Nocardia sp. NPDC006044]|uniref:hypothetical protein n=1 Tax=Nocardia sp. NPDC006044 TaxID=3364306 RepID=UPI0036A8B65D
MTSPIAPFDTDYLVDPYAVHRKLRESAPVHRVALPDGTQAWLVTREADVRRGLADPRLSIDKRSSTTGYKGFALPPVFEANLLNIDAPDHTRLRRLVSHAFTRRRVDSLHGKIQTETDLLLDGLAEREQPELIADFAAPLPLTVIGDLLGIPGEDRERFRAGPMRYSRPIRASRGRRRKLSFRWRNSWSIWSPPNEPHPPTTFCPI